MDIHDGIRGACLIHSPKPKEKQKNSFRKVILGSVYNFLLQLNWLNNLNKYANKAAIIYFKYLHLSMHLKEVHILYS